MRKKIVAGNWKMNMNLQDGVALAKEINEALVADKPNCDVVICTPFIHLASVAQVLDSEIVGLGAENCADKAKGAFTGEVSAEMVKSTGAQYVILGHSERRQYYGETAEILKEKVELALANGLNTQFVPPTLTPEHLVIDGLFGSGLNKPLSGGFAAVVKYINASPAMVVSIDIPSGLMGEENTFNVKSNIIRADVTFSLQLPKLAFLFAENTEFVGEWELLDIQLSEEGIEETETNYEMLEIAEIRSLIKPRRQFAHKGNFGHALLIAGSKGMAGASVLAARACLRSGVGLLTIHAPLCNNDILQTSAPEAMVETDASETCFAVPTDTDDYQAVGVGPGLGRSEETEAALIEQLEHCQTPTVVDADALNILANHRHTLTHLPKGSILTPHPKELERLIGKCQDSYERLMKACELAHTAKVHIILKGAYSTIITPEGKCYFNPTGNPGMATGGSGDVLTGVILALLAQGYPAEDAAKIGTYIHGLAGDIAQKKQGMIGLIASDIVTCLPAAWRLVSE